MVCNGHYNTPSIPNYPGKKLFTVTIIDALIHLKVKQYLLLAQVLGKQTQFYRARNINFFEFSGMDLAYEISKVAVSVTLSHHHKTDPLTKFPDNVNLKPDVKCLTENGVEFVDGSRLNYSVIFYCTGNETMNELIYILNMSQ